MAQTRIQNTIYSDLFPEPSKTEKRVIQIVEAAIKNYATIGIDKTTYDRIAKTCKISRPLIQHYFKDKDAVFQMAIKYIRANYQQYVVDAMEGKTKAVDLLSAYVQSALAWQAEYPQHARTWLLFFYQCTLDKKLKTLNSSLTEMGHQRIQELLKLGESQGDFKIGDLPSQAKQIQTIINGAIITEMTEELFVESKKFHRQTITHCLHVAGATDSIL